MSGDLPRDANWLIGVTVLAEVGRRAARCRPRARAVRAARALRGPQRGRRAGGDLQLLRLAPARHPRRRARGSWEAGQGSYFADALDYARAAWAPARGRARTLGRAGSSMLLARGEPGGRQRRARELLAGAVLLADAVGMDVLAEHSRDLVRSGAPR